MLCQVTMEDLEEEEYKIDQNADMNYSNAHLNVSKQSNPPNKEE